MAAAQRRSAAIPDRQKKTHTVDWDAVARDYRATQMTLRELAKKHGCSHGRVAQKAKALGWSRDLMPAIRQATDAKLVEAAVHSILTTEAAQATQGLTNAVLIAAEINTQVILQHRKGLRDITAVRNLLLAQVAQAAASLPDLGAIIEMLRNEDDSGADRANDALRKVLGRSGVIDDLKKLAEVDERVRKGEREAFGITSDAESAGDATKKIKRVLLAFEDAEVRGG